MSKSYLRWVGGKSQIADVLIRQFPQDISRYIEPFCGSCAMFFAYYGVEDDIFNEKPPALLSDCNFHLMNTHEAVKNQPERVIEILKRVQSVFDNQGNKSEHYYRCREEFNNEILSKPQCHFGSVIEAVSFIAINKMCFNGLWRVNSSGLFNVPFNQKENIQFCSKKILNRCSELLNLAELSCNDFRTFIEDNVKQGDFVFIDPPYIPLSATSSFTSYTDEGWESPKDDQSLNEMLKIIDKKGAKFMMTNSESSLVYNIFKQWNINHVDVHRFVKAISKPNEKRSKIKETVVTNYVK